MNQVVTEISNARLCFYIAIACLLTFLVTLSIINLYYRCYIKKTIKDINKIINDDVIKNIVKTSTNIAIIEQRFSQLTIAEDVITCYSKRLDKDLAMVKNYIELVTLFSKYLVILQEERKDNVKQAGIAQ